MIGFLQLLPPFQRFFAAPQRFLWHPDSATAVLSDLHLGGEASLARHGIFLPDTSSAALQAAWQALCLLKPAHIIIAGDLFDAPNPPAGAINFFRELLTQLPPATRLTLTPGNHDPLLSTLAQLFPTLHIESSASIDEIVICHGHDLPAPLPPALIVGHQHPAVILRSRIQSAKMICFATCTLPDQHALLLLPALSPLPLGSNLLTQRHWLIPLPRPAEKNIRIAGIITPSNAPAVVLDFGPLEMWINGPSGHSNL